MFVLRWANHIGMLPRDLLERVTVDDIREMMAFERLEPFGALADEFRLGVIAATVANVNRGPDSDALYPQDFMPALRRAMEPAQEQRREMDPDELSALIDATMFGRVKQTVH